MSELIRAYEDVAILNPETAARIANFEKVIKEAKEREDELKRAILEEMESKNLLKVETDDLVISYIAPSDRETLDSKALRKELPDIYDAYVRITPVKSSLRVRVK